MITNVAKRFAGIIMAVVIALTMIPLTNHGVSAASLVGLSDPAIGLETSGDGEWIANANTLKGAVTGQSGGACGSGSSKVSTITLKNKKSGTATLSFTYTAILNGGTVTVDGTAAEDKKPTTFSKSLESGESIDIKLISPKEDKEASIDIGKISLLKDIEATTVFVPAENGSFTVDGAAITQEKSITQSSGKAYQLKATASTGYRFLGWYNINDKAYISFDNEASLNIDTDSKITAKFVDKEAAVFTTSKGGQFTDLQEAVSFAQTKKADKVILASTGKITGNYTIPKDITLLIPFDSNNTCYTTEPGNVKTSYTKPTKFRELTMAQGSSITVEGQLCVSAKHAAGAGGSNYGGSPSGPCSFINMEKGSDITINNGAGAYVYGFIHGAGRVTAKTGSTVYENFQIADFRGGSETSHVVSSKIFPFSQYYVQNIEVEEVLEAGAEEYVYSSLYVSKSDHSTSVHFFGQGGMFVPAEGTTVTKKYDSSTDRLILDVDGDFSINPLSLSVGVLNVNSDRFNLPITNNISINVLRGTTTTDQDIALLPGAAISVKQGAALQIAKGKNLFVYDRDQWVGKKFVMRSDFIKQRYTASKRYNRTEADLKDARIDVNGQLIADGFVYTTESGADICSSERTGQFIQKNTPGTETTTQQYANNSNFADIVITPAKLHNGEKYAGTDKEFTPTVEAKEGDVFPYVAAKNMWKDPSAATPVTVTFNANGGTGDMADLETDDRTEVQLSENSFAKEGATFQGWSESLNGPVKYTDKETVKLTDDVTLYAVWKNKTYTVTWQDDDGTVLEKDENVEHGTMASYDGKTPTKEADSQYTYTFKGWSPKVDKVTEDVIYKAEYEKTVNKYEIRWLDEDGTEISKEKVAYGEVPSFKGNEPIKAEDEDNTYTFSTWSPEIVAVTGNADYTAVFVPTARTYDVQWINDDGTVLKEAKQVTKKTEPKYDGDIPTKDADAQYSYEFADWTKTVDEETGNVTYKATYTKTLQEYTITWQNGDQILGTDTVVYGQLPVYAGKEPEKEGETPHKYVFEGWTPEVTEVTGEATYKAAFTKVLHGWLESDKGRQYYVNDQLQKTGWTAIDGQFYYLDPETGYAALGAARVPYPGKDVLDGYGPNEEDIANDGKYPYPDKTESVFIFNDKTGAFESSVNGTFQYQGKTCWAINGELPWNVGLVKDGDDYYYYAADRNLYKNGDLYISRTNDMKLDIGGAQVPVVKKGIYTFDKEGKLQRNQGIVDTEKGKFYYENYRKMAGAGLIKLDGSYYYVKRDGSLVYGRDYWITNTNGLQPEGKYTFEADGKMVIKNAPQNQNGIVAEDGSLFYYKDGKRYYAGLIQIDGDYYYVKSSGEVIHDRDYWITKHNDLKPLGKYTFDKEGKMQVQKNGIVKENGKLMYYKDNSVYSAGLIKIDNDYYYVRSNGQLVTGRAYWTTKHNGLLPLKQYQFDQDGKMINPPAGK